MLWADVPDYLRSATPEHRPGPASIFNAKLSRWVYRKPELEPYPNIGCLGATKVYFAGIGKRWVKCSGQPAPGGPYCGVHRPKHIKQVLAVPTPEADEVVARPHLIARATVDLNAQCPHCRHNGMVRRTRLGDTECWLCGWLAVGDALVHEGTLIGGWSEALMDSHDPYPAMADMFNLPRTKLSNIPARALAAPNARTDVLPVVGWPVEVAGWTDAHRLRLEAARAKRRSDERHRELYKQRQGTPLSDAPLLPRPQWMELLSAP